MQHPIPTDSASGPLSRSQLVTPVCSQQPPYLNAPSRHGTNIPTLKLPQKHCPGVSLIELARARARILASVPLEPAPSIKQPGYNAPSGIYERRHSRDSSGNGKCKGTVFGDGNVGTRGANTGQHRHMMHLTLHFDAGVGGDGR